jgi:acyl carrier protein
MRNVFERVRLILHQKYSFHSDQIQPEVKFEKELGTDSREMLELMNDFEKEFEIEIALEAVEEIEILQDVVDYVDYIEKEINSKKKFSD